MTCKLCNDTRHVWDEDRSLYVPCSCLLERQRRKRYRKAGIPERYNDETWKTFAKTYVVRSLSSLVGVVRELRGGNVQGDWALVHGRPTRARSLCAALTLRSACDGGLNCRRYDLPELIDAEFQPGRGRECYEVPVMLIEVGGEPTNKWNRVVLEKALHKRWEASLFTMLVVDGDPQRVFESYKSSKVLLATNERFVRVRLSPKEDK